MRGHLSLQSIVWQNHLQSALREKTVSTENLIFSSIVHVIIGFCGLGDLTEDELAKLDDLKNKVSRFFHYFFTQLQDYEEILVTVSRMFPHFPDDACLKLTKEIHEVSLPHYYHYLPVFRLQSQDQQETDKEQESLSDVEEVNIPSKKAVSLCESRQ